MSLPVDAEPALVPLGDNLDGAAVGIGLYAAQRLLHYIHTHATQCSDTQQMSIKHTSTCANNAAKKKNTRVEQRKEGGGQGNQTAKQPVDQVDGEAPFLKEASNFGMKS